MSTRPTLRTLWASASLGLIFSVAPNPLSFLSMDGRNYHAAEARDGHHGDHGGHHGGGHRGGDSNGQHGGDGGDNGTSGSGGDNGDGDHDGDGKGNGGKPGKGNSGENGGDSDHDSDGNGSGGKPGKGNSGENGENGGNDGGGKGKPGKAAGGENTGDGADQDGDGKPGKGSKPGKGADNNDTGDDADPNSDKSADKSKAKDKKSVVATPEIETPVAAPETSASGNAPGAADHKSGEVVGVGMSDADVSTAEAMGFSVATPVAQPKSLETPVVELMVPKGMSEDEARKSLAAAFPGRAFGLNNLYSGYHTATSASSASKGTSGGGDARCSGDQCYGRVMIGWQQSLETCSSGLAIGMIDTGIDLESQAFAGSAIVARRFSPSGTQEEAYGHATGVAALIVGNGQLGTPGLLPKARLVAADVFYLDENKHVVTDTASLLKALDWLDQAGVKIVNMSFSGPQDDLVAKALANMSAKGVVFVAAAGNNGPAAAPAFPAAYDEVIAVTAVDNRMRGYIQANQGDYIDVAAPGVKIWTAAPKNRSIYQSGTSFAVPFVTAALAAELDSGATGAARDWLVTSGIDDIGAPGADAIFGRGLLRAPKSCGAPEGDLFSSLSSSAPGDETASTSVAQR